MNKFVLFIFVVYMLSPCLAVFMKIGRFIPLFGGATEPEEDEAVRLARIRSSSSMHVPAMARKAGGSIRSEVLSKSNNVNASEVKQDCPTNDYYNDFWKRCVPIHCYQGERWRNKRTGQCMVLANVYGTSKYVDLASSNGN